MLRNLTYAFLFNIISNDKQQQQQKKVTIPRYKKGLD